MFEKTIKTSLSAVILFCFLQNTAPAEPISADESYYDDSSDFDRESDSAHDDDVTIQKMAGPSRGSSDRRINRDRAARSINPKKTKKKTQSKRSRHAVKKQSDSSSEGEAYKIYRPKKGDTLYSISRKFGARVDDICRLNGFNKNSPLPADTRIKIPVVAKKGGRPAEREESGHHFIWPLRKISGISRDGQDGVRPIGLIIKGEGSAQVISSASGTVKKIGFMRGFGRYVVIKHGDGYLTVYAKMDKVSVSEGEKINIGGVIGRIDGSERRLHFLINCGGRALDPLKVLPKRS
jgi:LysM repeat protein